MLDAAMLREGDELPGGEFDGMSDAAIEERLAVIEHFLAEDSPQAIEVFLASPAGQKGGPERVARLRAMFDDVRDWQLGRRGEGLAELRRRQDAATGQARKAASAKLYFGPWQGFGLGED